MRRPGDRHPRPAGGDTARAWPAWRQRSGSTSKAGCCRAAAHRQASSVCRIALHAVRLCSPYIILDPGVRDGRTRPVLIKTIVRVRPARAAHRVPIRRPRSSSPITGGSLAPGPTCRSASWLASIPRSAMIPLRSRKVSPTCRRWDNTKTMTSLRRQLRPNTSAVRFAVPPTLVLLGQPTGYHQLVTGAGLPAGVYPV